jgi:hypothetical protein
LADLPHILWPNLEPSNASAKILYLNPMSNNKKAYNIHQLAGKHYTKSSPLLKHMQHLENYKFVQVFKLCGRIANKYVSFLYSLWSAMEDPTFFNTTYSNLYGHPQPDSNLWTPLLSGCPKCKRNAGKIVQTNKRP